MIGIDTNAIIDLFKNDNNIKELLSKIDDEIIVSTYLNHFEIFIGIDQKDEEYRGEVNYYDILFEDIKLLNLSKDSSKLASKILWDLKKRGKIIDQKDIAIAAILLSNGVNKIITKNKKHFENIKGLEVLSY